MINIWSKIAQIGRGGGQKLSKLRRKVGAILIEFAFAIPVFLVLLYYIHDLPKQKLMQRKMQFVAYEMAAILQNIAEQRKITKEDFKNATRLAYLSVFPGTTMYSKNASNIYLPLGYMPHTWTYCITGIGLNKAEMKWLCSTWSGNPELGPSNAFNAAVVYSEHEASSIRYKSGEASYIYPSLRILKGETKILAEVGLYYSPDRYFASGVKNKDVPPRKAFNFLLLPPKAYGNTKKISYFNAVSIFIPKSSGFSEEAPK